METEGETKVVDVGRSEPRSRWVRKNGEELMLMRDGVPETYVKREGRQTLREQGL